MISKNTNVSKAVAEDLDRHVDKPRCALEVAVVGNRRFARETEARPNKAAVQMRALAGAACAEVWEEIAEAMVSALDTVVAVPEEFWPHGMKLRRGTLRDFFGEGKPRLGVLSCLAAGADQIAVQAALRLNGGGGSRKVDVDLEAVLPFPEADYPGKGRTLRPEFRRAEAETLVALSKIAKQVVRMDGRYHAEKKRAFSDPFNAEARHRAYRDARDMLFQNADLVVAIYDPRAKAGLAGTVEAVRRAVEESVPVVAILVGLGETRIALYRTPDDLKRNGVPMMGEDQWAAACACGTWKEGVQSLIRYLLSVPHLLPAEKEDAEGTKQRLRALAETVGRLRRFFGDAGMHRVCWWPMCKNFLDQVWGGMLASARRFAERHVFSENEPAKGKSDEVVMEPYKAFYDRASLLAGAYMRTYRGTFVLTFLLVGFAVLLAVVLLAVALLSHGHPPFLVVAVLGVLKIGILIVLLVLELKSRRARFQEQAADFRYLAEALRPIQWLAPVGTSLPAVELPAQYAPLDPRQGWTHWLLRAIARATPSVCVRPGNCPQSVEFSVRTATEALDAARSEWVTGQIGYHWRNAVKMHVMETGLARWAKLLLWVVLDCVILAMLIESACCFGWIGRGECVRAGTVCLGAVAAALPAFIAAFGGILFQSEAKRLRIRSEAMYDGLRRQDEVLKKMLEQIRATGGSGFCCDTWRVARRLRAVSGMMIEETSDWKALYQLHEVKAG